MSSVRPVYLQLVCPEPGWFGPWPWLGAPRSDRTLLWAPGIATTSDRALRTGLGLVLLSALALSAAEVGLLIWTVQAACAALALHTEYWKPKVLYK